MTPDQKLRAVAALEAAWTHDVQALVLLARRMDGEKPLSLLLAAYAERVLRGLIAAHLRECEHGDPADRGKEEFWRTDPVMTTSLALATTYHCWADTADQEDLITADSLARCILLGLATVEGGGTRDEDLVALIGRLRARAIAGGEDEYEEDDEEEGADDADGAAEGPGEGPGE
ncbi:hypothetical protein [Kitasatospora sp. LaBMicrA B282]|uniref:hypothetical protein n=1 Tax=Kitasatospora sp. LaBMicrA B282 TaxID=3420949 RepID=UPI003D0F64BF